MEMTIPIVCLGSCSANVCPHTFGKEGVFQLHLKIEKRVRILAPCGSRTVKFLMHDLFVR